MNSKIFSSRAASVLVCIVLTGLLTPLNCGAPNSGGGNNGADASDPFPTLSGCLGRDSEVVGKPFELTISISESTLIGVAPNQFGSDADVVVARVNDQSFTAVVTPREEGGGTVEFFIEYSEEIDLSTESHTLECRFTAIANSGACCESLSCEVTDEDECFFRDGAYLGAGTTCANNPCVGACCELGTCFGGMLESECVQQGGDYRGGGSLCVDTFCESPVDGACCLADGSCVETPSELDCGILVLDGSSSFLGLGTDCMSATCPGSDGACCIGDGTCVDDTSEDGCRILSLSLGTAFQGAGSVCAGRTCTVTAGACCFGEGFCTETTLEACDSLTGLSGISSTFRGAGTPCVITDDFFDGFEVCGGAQLGACCWSFGRCENATVERCGLLHEGVFIGLHISCRDFERLPDTCTVR